MASNKVLDIIIEAHNKASKEINALRSDIEHLNQVGARMRDVGSQFMAMGALAGAGIGYAIKTTADFEQAVANAGSVMGRTAGDWEDIAKVAREYGATTTYTATESAGAIQLLAQYGYDLSDAQKMMASTTKLATAQQYDLGMATDIVVSTLKNFESQGYSTAQIADVFAKASNISSANLDKFRYSLKYTAPVANALGISLEDMTAQLSMLYDAGLPAETAGTALRMAYNRLLSPTKGATKALEKYGITLDEINPQTNKMADIIDRLNKAGMETNDVFELFGVETAPSMLAMMSQGGDALRDYEKQLKNATGTVEDMYETQMSTFNNQLKLLKAKLEELAITFGEILLPAVTDLVGGLSELADWLNGLSKETKEFIGYGTVAFGIFTLISGAVLFFGGTLLTAMASVRLLVGYIKNLGKFMKIGKIFKNVASAVGTLRVAFSLAGIVFKAFIWALMQNPIARIIMGIISAVGIFKQAWDSNWGGIQEKTRGVWDWLKSAGQTLIDWFSGAWDTAVQAVQDFGTWISDIFTEVWNTISTFFTDTYNEVITWAQSIPEAISTAWSGLTAWVSSLWQSVKSTIYNFLLGILMDTGQTQSQARQTLEQAWANIGAFFSTIWEGVKYVFYGAWVELAGTVQEGAQWVWQGIQVGFSNISSFFTTIWNGIVMIVQTAWSWISQVVSMGVQWVWTKIVTGWTILITFAQMIWNGITMVVQTQWNMLQNVVSVGLSFLSGIWQSIWSVIGSYVTTIWSQISSVVSSAWSFVQNMVMTGLTVLQAGWTAIWSAIVAFFQSIWNTIQSIVQSAMAILQNVIALGINLIAGNWQQAWQNVQNIVREAWNIVKDIVTAGLDAVIAAIQGFFGVAEDSGRALMEAFANGIKGAISLVTGAVKSVTDAARRFFGFSDAKEGAFSNITYSGYATMSAFAKGATSAKNMLSRAVGGTLDSAMSGATAGTFMLGGMKVSGMGNQRPMLGQNEQPPVINITINANGEADAEDIANAVIKKIEKKMKR